LGLLGLLLLLVLVLRAWGGRVGRGLGLRQGYIWRWCRAWNAAMRIRRRRTAGRATLSSPRRILARVPTLSPTPIRIDAHRAPPLAYPRAHPFSHTIPWITLRTRMGVWNHRWHDPWFVPRMLDPQYPNRIRAFIRDGIAIQQIPNSLIQVSRPMPRCREQR
jgi:hypothetical protein